MSKNIAITIDEIKNGITEVSSSNKILSTRESLFYTLPNIGFCAFMLFAVNFTILMYVNIMGQPPIIIGIIYASSLIVFAFTSIIWGAISDKIGKKRILWVVGPLMIGSFVLLWIPPIPSKDMSYGSVYVLLLIWFIVFLFIFRVSSAGYHTSMYALLPELSSDGQNRVKISMLNTLMMIIGSIIGVFGPIILLSQTTQNLDREDPVLYYPQSSIGAAISIQIFLFSLFIGIFFLVTFVLLQLSLKQEPKKKSTQIPLKILLKEMFIPFKDKNYRVWLIALFLFNIPSIAFQYIIISFAAFVLKLRGIEFTIFVLIAFTCSVVSFVIWLKLIKKVGLKMTLTICIVIAGICYFLIPILSLPMDRALLLFIGITLITILIGTMVATMAFPLALMSKLIESSEQLSNKKLAGTYSGAHLTVSSGASATAMLIVSISLQAFSPGNIYAYNTIFIIGGILSLVSAFILHKVKTR